VASSKPLLLILGDGTFAIEALDVAEAMDAFQPVGFVNSFERPPSDRRHAGLPVHFVDDIAPPAAVLLAGGLVSTKRRALVEQLAARGYEFATLSHPSSVVSKRSCVLPGCFIGAQNVVGANSKVGPYVVINRGVLVGHDNTIESFVTLGPGANVAGCVRIGAGAHIGVGAVVRDHLTIGSGSIVAAGAVVVKNVEPHVLVAGVPAQVVRRDVEPL